MIVELLVGGAVGYLIGSDRKRSRNPNPIKKPPRKPRKANPPEWAKFSRGMR